MSVVNIVLINLVLSSDNALIIGMAVKDLQRADQKKVLLYSTIGIILLYILFSFIASILLTLSYVKLIGGLTLIYIAFNLMIQKDDKIVVVSHKKNMWQAMKVIMIANVVIGIDNVLVISGIARGDIALIILGVMTSIILIVVGSKYIAKLVHDIPFLLYLGAGFLFITAIKMVIDDPVLSDKGILENALYLPYVVTVIFLLIASFINGRKSF